MVRFKHYEKAAPLEGGMGGTGGGTLGAELYDRKCTYGGCKLIPSFGLNFYVYAVNLIHRMELKIIDIPPAVRRRKRGPTFH